MEKERQTEIAVINNACEVLGREIFEIQPDGHCMFAAVADQLGAMGVLSAEKVGWSRRTAVPVGRVRLTLSG